MKNRTSFIDGFSEILARHQILSASDIKSLHKSFKDRNDVTFEEFLLQEGLADKAEILKAMSEYYKVPSIDVQGEFFDHFLLRLFPKDLMIRLGFIPQKRYEDSITVIVANPFNPFLRGIISRYIMHEVVFNVSFLSDIQNAIQEFYDLSITPQPNSIQNQRMVRSQISIFDTYQNDFRIPLDLQETDDDYESH